MTNEEFIQELLDAEYVLPEAIVPYARKLVAVAEAVKIVSPGLVHSPKTCMQLSGGNICKCGIGDLQLALEQLDEKEEK